MVDVTNIYGAFCKETAALGLEMWESSGETPSTKKRIAVKMVYR